MYKQRNAFLTEEMGGCAQDEGLFRDSGYLCCVKCNQIVDRGMTPCLGVTDFSTGDGFFKLWNWSREQVWWGNFLEYFHCNYPGTLITYLIDPDTFANLIYQYIGREFIKERFKEIYESRDTVYPYGE